MKFSELLTRESKSNPGDIQNSSRLEFPKLLKDKGLYLRKPRGPLPTEGTLVILGFAAAYSLTDLNLLDEIYSGLIIRKNERIEIFDTSILSKMEAWEDYIPGLAPVYQTPVIGICSNSIWTLRESGHAAREFIKKRYLNPQLST